MMLHAPPFDCRCVFDFGASSDLPEYHFRKVNLHFFLTFVLSFDFKFPVYVSDRWFPPIANGEVLSYQAGTYFVFSLFRLATEVKVKLSFPSVGLFPALSSSLGMSASPHYFYCRVMIRFLMSFPDAAPPQSESVERSALLRRQHLLMVFSPFLSFLREVMTSLIFIVMPVSFLPAKFC